MQEPIQEPTAAPPPKSESRRTYVDLDANKARFSFRPAKDAAPQATGRVQGFLRGFWLEWDHGRPNSDPKQHIPARWNLRVAFHRARTDEGEVLGDALVTVGASVPFLSLAEQVLQARENAYLSLAATEARNSTFIDAAIWDGREWSYVYTPAAGGVPFEDRYNSAVARLKASTLYDEMETPKEPPEGATWRRRNLASELDPALKARLDAARPPVSEPTAPPPANPSPQPEPVQTSAATPNAPAQETAGVAATGTATQGAATTEAPEPEVVAPDPLPSAFGVQAPRWVKSYTKEASESQYAALLKKGAERGFVEPPVLRSVAEAVLAAYKVPSPIAGRPLSSGYVTLVYDWLGAATAEALDAAKAAAVYDPFADE